MRQSVDEELARHQALRHQAASAAEMPAEEFAAAKGYGPANGNGHARGDSNGNGHASGLYTPPRRSNGRARSRPSARQMTYAHGLAGRLGMDAGQLDGLCRRLFEKPLAALTGGEASELIRALQEMREGWQGPDEAQSADGE